MSGRVRGGVAVLLAVLVCVTAWGVLRDGDPEQPQQTTARTPDGALTFAMPATWRTRACPADEGDCLRVTSPDMTEAEAATVAFLPPNPVEGTPVDALVNPGVTVPGSTSVTVDGLPATRLDPDEQQGQDAILVAGRARTAVGSTFMVLCPVGGDPESSRAMCDQILRTLKVTR
ncbi:hypothetical protein [Knoellia aerolata]|uniref:hypothetical protein n=1 Tax=Knoellia aerolata TaxID=442954 RepID=UPI0012EE7EC1|nr:hypothetical protein [Knoellia aerolata]